MEPLQPKQRLHERFVLLKRLSTGAFGELWLAQDVKSGDRVALRVVDPRLDERGAARLRRIAPMLAEVAHPNVARTLGYDLERKPAYLVGEYVPGSTLIAAMQSYAQLGAFFPEGDALAIVDQLCRALTYAHERDLLHLRLQPKNVVVRLSAGQVEVKLLDLGQRQILGERAVEGEDPEYLSPEQIRGDPVDRRADLFALATIFFELLTLHRPHQRDEQGQPVRLGEVTRHRIRPELLLAIPTNITGGPRPKPSLVRPDLPRGVDAVFARAFAVSPSERYPSAAELARALLGALQAERTDPAQGADGKLVSLIDRSVAEMEGDVAELIKQAVAREQTQPSPPPVMPDLTRTDEMTAVEPNPPFAEETPTPRGDLDEPPTPKTGAPPSRSPAPPPAAKGPSWLLWFAVAGWVLLGLVLLGRASGCDPSRARQAEVEARHVGHGA